jgi:hypothetical protein
MARQERADPGTSGLPHPRSWHEAWTALMSTLGKTLVPQRLACWPQAAHPLLPCQQRRRHWCRRVRSTALARKTEGCGLLGLPFKL